MKQFEPSAKKLKDAKAKGDYVKSKDTASFLYTFGGSLIFVFYCYLYVAELFRSLFSFWSNFASLESQDLLLSSINSCFKLLFDFIYPLLLMFFILGISSSGIQSKFYIDFSRFKLINAKFNLIDGLKKLFPVKTKSDSSILFNITKFLILTALLFISLGIFTFFIYTLAYRINNIDNMLLSLFVYLEVFYLASLFLFLIIFCCAIVDYFMVAKKRKKRLMMDASELKKEIKDSEGDPMINSMRKGLHQEVLNQAALSQVRHARVVVVD